MLRLSRPGIFLMIVTFICQVGHGQSLMPGYIVTTDQDSILGAICCHDELQQQAGVDFMPLNGIHRRWLDAHQVKAYGYIHRRDTVRYVAVVLTSGAPQGAVSCLFLRQLVAGAVELYEYRYTPSATYSESPLNVNELTWDFPPLSLRSARFGSGYALVVHYPAHHVTNEITWWNFPTDAAAYFADYPALAGDLQTKHYRLRDIAQVIKRYNSWCTAIASANNNSTPPQTKIAGTGH